MTDTQTQYQVLDPCLLGRPVHRLPQFAAQLREDLMQAMRLPMHRRYWAAFQVGEVAFSRLQGREESLRWLHFSAPGGSIAFAMERKVLLAVLNYRYGRGKGSLAVADESQIKVTATEERLAVALGQQLAATLAGRIELNLPAVDRPEGETGGDEIRPAAGSHPPKGTWVVTVTVGESGGGMQGRIFLALDKQLISDVLRGLLPERDAGRKAAKPAVPLAARLQVGLNGRLVSKEISLGALFDMRVGDVIPISLNRAEVMLEDSRLFSAAVTEHKGKLCLTSFEDIE
jgi:flagellar motor switch protein FliM